MFFDSLLYGSLFIFLIGFVYKFYTWVSRQAAGLKPAYTTGQRISQVIKGVLSVIFSAKILLLLKILILDVILQRRILKEDALRWVMHMLIFVGFTLLLLIHAFESFISVNVFEDYASTGHPYLFLRNLFGIMVFVGVAIAVYRRFILKVPRLRSSGMDVYAIIIVAVIMVTGFLLEGAKIVSHNDFQRMVEEYSDSTEEADVKALEAFWVLNYGLASPNVTDTTDEALLEQGAELHDMSCQACHAVPQWAFVSYGVSRVMRPMARFLDDCGCNGFSLGHPYSGLFYRTGLSPFQQNVPSRYNTFEPHGQCGHG